MFKSFSILLLGLQITLWAAPYTITSTPPTKAFEPNSQFYYELNSSVDAIKTLSWRAETLPSFLKEQIGFIDKVIDINTTVPTDISSDSSGVVYILDSATNTIQRLEENGTLTPITLEPILIGSTTLPIKSFTITSDNTLTILRQSALINIDLYSIDGTYIYSFNISDPYGVIDFSQYSSASNLYILNGNYKLCFTATNNSCAYTYNILPVNANVLTLDSDRRLYALNNCIIYKSKNVSFNNEFIQYASISGCRATDMDFNSKDELYVSADRDIRRYINGNEEILQTDINLDKITVATDQSIYALSRATKKVLKVVPKAHIRGTLPAEPGVYDINVSAFDGVDRLYHTFSLRIRGNILSNNTIAENNTIGDVIATLSTIGDETNSTFNYSFCGGVDDSAFSFSDNNLSAATIFDYESKKSYDICIRASDNSGNIYDSNFTISITDSNDAPKINSSPITTIYTNSKYSYMPKGSDPEGNRTIWDIAAFSTLPPWLELQQAGIFKELQSNGIPQDSADNISMVIDSKGVIYLAYRDTSSFQARLLQYRDKQWQSAGNDINATIEGITLAIDSNDILHVAYIDKNNSLKATVKKLDGLQWQSVGDPVSSNPAYNPSLAFDNSNTPYLAYIDLTDNSNVHIKKYDGTEWVSVGGTISSNNSLFPKLAFNSQNHPLVAFRDGSQSNKITVLDFNGTSWQPLGNRGFSDDLVGYISLAVDNSDRAYVAYMDSAYGYKATVMRYDTNGSWQPLGTKGFTPKGASNLAFILDSSDTPYIAYRDDNSAYRVSVSRFSNGQWQVVDKEGVSSGSARDISLAFSKEDQIYVAYADTANGNRATVITKYDTDILYGTAPSTPATFDVNLTLSDGAKTTPHNFQISVIAPPPPTTSTPTPTPPPAPTEDLFFSNQEGVTVTGFTTSSGVVNSVSEEGTTFSATKRGDGTITTAVTSPQGTTTTTSELEISTTFMRDSSGDIVLQTTSSFTNSAQESVALQTTTNSQGEVEVSVQIGDSNTTLNAPAGSSVTTDANGTVEITLTNTESSCTQDYKEVSVTLYGDGTSAVTIQTFSCEGELLDESSTLIAGELFERGSNIEVIRELDGTLHVVITTPLNGTIEF